MKQFNCTRGEIGTKVFSYCKDTASEPAPQGNGNTLGFLHHNTHATAHVTWEYVIPFQVFHWFKFWEKYFGLKVNSLLFIQKHITIAQPCFEGVNTCSSLPFIAPKAAAPHLLTPAGHGSISCLEAGWGNTQNIGSVGKWLLTSLPVCSEL